MSADTATQPRRPDRSSILTREQTQTMRRLRWTAFGLVALSYMLSFFHRMAPAAISGDLAASFQTTGASLGVLAASYFYVYTVMQVPTGVLVDTLGPRAIVTIGGLVAGAGSVLFGLAPTLEVAVAGRALAGLGVSVVFVSLLKLNAAWFYDRQFATLSGLTLLLGNVGAVLSAAPLAWLVTLTSWRSVFVAAGGISLLLGLLTWWLVRDAPGTAGLPSMREMEGKTAHAPHEGHWLEGLRGVLANRCTWPGFWVALGASGTFFTFGGLWAVPFLREVHGMTAEAASLHTTALLIGFAVGSLAIGSLSDQLGRRRPVIIGTLAVMMLCWPPLLIGYRMPLSASLGLFALMGLGFCGFTLVWAHAKEVNPPALSGMATSVVNTGGFLGAALLQPLVGWVMDLSTRARGLAEPATRTLADYRFGLGLLAAASLFGLIAALFVRETYCRYLMDQSPPARGQTRAVTPGDG